jgi:hypothetical protein
MAYTNQEVKNFIDNIYASGGTAADVARAAVEYGVPANQIATATNQTISTVAKELADEIAIQQYGRTLTAKEASSIVKNLSAGENPLNIATQLNQSLEGQNFDTQYLTSLGRQLIGANPDQQNYQYFMSLAQSDPLAYGDSLRQAVLNYTGIDPGSNFTNIDSASLEADPYGGRFATQSIYDVLADAANVSNIAGRQAQFVNPATQQSITSQFNQAFADRNVNEYIQGKLQGVDVNNPEALRQANISIYQDALANNVSPEQISRVLPYTVSQIQQFGTENLGRTLQSQFSATKGADVINTPAAQAAISRALASGTMTQADVDVLVADLTKAQTPEQMRAAYAKPQGKVVLDAIYGQQIGEAKTLADAQAEAAQRQAVLNATDQGYYQGNMQLADAYRAAGLDFPFGQEAYQGYDTRIGQANVLNPQNFNAKVNELLSGLNQQFGQQFGQPVNMVTPLTGQYYSETGLQPGFTPVGTPGTMFRSGVAGYVPQAQLPTGFQFGVQPVNVPTQAYQPGAFQPAGVTTGGFITGYDANQQPIYSTYNNPNVNVGNVPSTLNPFTNQNQELQNMFTALRPLVTSIQANQG